MTRRRDREAAEDPGLAALVDCFAPVVTLVGKTWALHLDKVTKVSRDENLAMISDSVRFCAEAGKRVIYDAEHFFDGWRDDPGYALACLEAAVEAGAENLTLCDTNGSSLPHEIEEATAAVVAAYAAGPAGVGIHTHNDAECGVANSIAAVRAGATLVQGTINGYGERTGNANLVSILPALQLKLGYECVAPERLRLLTETAHLVDEICNLAPGPLAALRRPQRLRPQGRPARRRGRGRREDVRAHGPARRSATSREILISELAGRGSVIARAARAGIELDDDGVRRSIEKIKEREHRGYSYEAADASFELLLRHEAGTYEPLFRLESFRVVTEKRADGRVETEATIKLWVGEQRYIRTAEGNGPVNALDRALRAAITEQHPEIAEVELTNFKVRILDEHHGTASVTRVLLDSSDGARVVGLARRLRERHRGVLGGARRLARVRLPAARRRSVRRGRPAGRGSRRGLTAPERIPLARPVLGEREEELVLEVLRSGMLSLGPMLPRFEADFADGSASPTRSPSRAARRPCTSPSASSAGGAGDEVLTTPLSFIASSNCLLFEDATAGLLRRRSRRR